MQLGKALVGAFIGACVGIVLLLIVYLTMGIDKVWLSIPFAIITGLGVRAFVNTGGHASYVRGALTMLVALTAYIGGWMVVAQVATAKANATVAKPPVVDEEKPAAAEPGDTEGKDDAAKDAEAQGEKQETDASGEKKEADATPKAAAPKAAPIKTESAMPRATTPRAVAYTPWDIICLAIAALVAYEMGRGSGISVPSGQLAQSTPVSTHPDA